MPLHLWMKSCSHRAEQRREDAAAIDDTEETRMGEHHWSPVGEKTETKATDNRQPFEKSRTDASFSMIVTR